METKIKMDFPAWLQNELDKRNWKPTELAQRAELDDGIISRALSGARMPSNKSLEKIADALGVPVEDILRHAGILPPSLDPERVKRAQAIANRIATFRPDLQDLAEDFVNMLFERNKREKNGRNKQP